MKDWSDPWPFIEAIREGAGRVVDAAMRLGMGLRETAGDRYEAGRELFPALADRMHLAAAVAKCAAFMNQVEVAVKNVLRPDAVQLQSHNADFPEAQTEVERHERNLGLIAPAVRDVAEPMPNDSETDAQTDRDADEGLKDAPRGIRH